MTMTGNNELITSGTRIAESDKSGDNVIEIFAAHTTNYFVF